MNNVRRKALEEIMEPLREIEAALEEIAQQEEDAFENLPEGLQASERGAAMEEAAEQLRDALDAIATAAECIDGAVAG